MVHTDMTATGGGLILKGDTDKSILWNKGGVSTHDAFVVNQNVSIAPTNGLHFGDVSIDHWYIEVDSANNLTFKYGTLADTNLPSTVRFTVQNPSTA